MAVLSSIVIYSCREPLRAAQFEYEIQRIVRIDQQVRYRARRFGQRIQLHIDAAAGIIEATNTTDEESGAALRLHINQATQIMRVRSSAGRSRNGSGVKIDVLPDGRTATYMIELRSAKRRRWLLFCGITGQFVQFDNEREARDLQQLLAATRANTR